MQFRINRLFFAARLFTAVLAISVFSISQVAIASPQAAEATANRARKAYDAADFAEAARLYYQAWQADNARGIWLYSAARSSQKAGIWDVAADWYEKFLAAPGDGAEKLTNARTNLAEVRVKELLRKTQPAQQVVSEQDLQEKKGLLLDLTVGYRLTAETRSFRRDAYPTGPVLALRVGYGNPHGLSFFGAFEIFNVFGDDFGVAAGARLRGERHALTLTIGVNQSQYWHIDFGEWAAGWAATTSAQYEYWVFEHAGLTANVGVRGIAGGGSMYGAGTIGILVGL